MTEVNIDRLFLDLEADYALELTEAQESIKAIVRDYEEDRAEPSPFYLTPVERDQLRKASESLSVARGVAHDLRQMTLRPFIERASCVVLADLADALERLLTDFDARLDAAKNCEQEDVALNMALVRLENVFLNAGGKGIRVYWDTYTQTKRCRFAEFASRCLRSLLSDSSLAASVSYTSSALMSRWKRISDKQIYALCRRNLAFMSGRAKLSRNGSYLMQIAAHARLRELIFWQRRKP